MTVMKYGLECAETVDRPRETLFMNSIEEGKLPRTCKKNCTLYIGRASKYRLGSLTSMVYMIVEKVS